MWLDYVLKIYLNDLLLQPCEARIAHWRLQRLHLHPALFAEKLDGIDTRQRTTAYPKRNQLYLYDQVPRRLLVELRHLQRLGNQQGPKEGCVVLGDLANKRLESNRTLDFATAFLTSSTLFFTTDFNTLVSASLDPLTLLYRSRVERRYRHTTTK